MSEPKWKIFGDQLKRWRSLCQWTDDEIATIVSVSRVSVSKWMNGHSLPNAVAFIILIDAIATRTTVDHWTIIQTLKIDPKNIQ